MGTRVPQYRLLSFLYRKVKRVITGSQTDAICPAFWPTATVQRMARPYGEPVEIITAPIPAQSPFIPADAKIVVGAVAPAAPEPIPIVLLPGFEYRLRQWRHPQTHEVHWVLERRKATQPGDDDE